MGRLEGKVAFITGAARGQGRSHVVRLAEEGADIVAVDLCKDVSTVPYKLATPEDLEETVRLVEKTGRKIVARQADVRDFDALQAAANDGLAAFGHIDVVLANAGIGGAACLLDMTAEEWTTMLDVCLTGVWHTVKATVPGMVATGNGGSVIVVSSAAGLKPMAGIGHYVAAKSGVIGFARTLALELAATMVRVNVVAPGSVKTPMMLNDWTFKLFRPDLENPTVDDAIDAYKTLQPMPIPWVEPVDISNAIVFLASDEARYITGIILPVDGGLLLQSG